ncbi:porin [Bartonella sp. TP]|uniref:outer membrane protein n=1 Tax=Bartonella sp. TP TaxID=3057550 RepID=UPI0025B1A639|nr:porin [Bartonella sp. TP]WJW80360.1 outer membrane beta-barrel protein [Bartonella sp. TP]
MKTKLITAVSLLALGAATQANAADVIMHRHVAPVVVVKPVDTFSWAGLYLGAQGSFQWAKHDIRTGAANLPMLAIKKDGAGAGLMAGFNSNLKNGAVLGIETDILWNKIHNHFVILTGATGTTALKTIAGAFDEKWSGATRIRLGFAQGKLLPFLAGGIAYAKILTSGVAASAGENASLAITHRAENLVGWTAGAGIDYAVADNLLLRLEYRYNDFGKKNLPVTVSGTPVLFYNIEHRSHDARLAVAYKF